MSNLLFKIDGHTKNLYDSINEYKITHESLIVRNKQAYTRLSNSIDNFYSKICPSMYEDYKIKFNFSKAFAHTESDAKQKLTHEKADMLLSPENLKVCVESNFSTKDKVYNYDRLYLKEEADSKICLAKCSSAINRSDLETKLCYKFCLVEYFESLPESAVRIATDLDMLTL